MSVFVSRMTWNGGTTNGVLAFGITVRWVFRESLLGVWHNVEFTTGVWARLYMALGGRTTVPELPASFRLSASLPRLEGLGIVGRFGWPPFRPDTAG
jgi:hypothetical protein